MTGLGRAAGGFRTNGEGVPEDAVVEMAGTEAVDIQADSWAGTRVPGVPWAGHLSAGVPRWDVLDLR